VPKRVYDFIDEGGHNVIEEWLGGLDKQLRARMRAKLDVLLTVETDLPPKMLTDTKNPQIKELIVNAKEALRLFLCRGPQLKNEEWTLLFGAVERDTKYVPRNALELAEANRQLALRDPVKHREIRKQKNADSQEA
jgi:hypothetical protein